MCFREMSSVITDIYLLGNVMDSKDLPVTHQNIQKILPFSQLSFVLLLGILNISLCFSQF